MSKIEWTDETWNPTTGCDKVSQGCKNCYAEVMHKRLRGMYPEKYSKPFLGHVEVHETELLKPLKWKKPRMVFVNSMSDLFHEDVPFEFIDKVFEVIKESKHHTFQILTKRPLRMYRYLRRHLTIINNVIVGTSCEDEETYYQRSEYIQRLSYRGWLTMLSLEPLLGPIDLGLKTSSLFSFDWVIVGGESGHKARPIHPDWVRSIRDQCQKANVPFFFKQWGEWHNGWKVGKKKSGNILDGEQHLNFPTPPSDSKQIENSNNRRGPTRVIS